MLFPSFFHGFATAQGQRQLRGTGSISPGPEDPRVVDQGSHEGGESLRTRGRSSEAINV